MPRLIPHTNTMNRAAACYRLLSATRDDMMLYHARFTEPHKA
jgi:CRISPR/Cas system-associated endonuclease/helicase Cas3